VLAEIFGLDGVIVIVVAVVVIFGGSQIPKLARSLGSAQKEFKNGLQEGAATTPVGVAISTTSSATPATSDRPS
jgi:sec-independent protein translocase protein TatA